MAFPNSVVSYGFPIDSHIFTYNLNAAIVEADVGKALTIDTSGPNKFKLTADNDVVLGRLWSYEDRTQQGMGKVGAVQRRFKEKLPAAIGHSIVLGAVVTGSAVAGEVKLGTTQTEPKHNRCVEVGTDFVVVEYL